MPTSSRVVACCAVACLLSVTVAYSQTRMPTIRCSCCRLGDRAKVTVPPGYFDNFDLIHLASVHKPNRDKQGWVWEYRLEVADGTIQLANGKPYKVWTFNGLVPGPTLLAREGDRVRITLTNKTSTPHTIHSHGLFVPNRMDGVAQSLHGTHDLKDLPDWAKPVMPGATFTYEYIARPQGTHWYHCHVNANEHLDRGMSGALVVIPKAEEPKVDHDVVMVLDEWNSKYSESGTPGHPKEINDYDFFTINGQSFPYTGTLAVKLNDTVRIRFVNAGAQPHFMHIHGHTLLVTHRDGAVLESPIERDTVPVGPGECTDVVLVANNPGTWPIHCHSVSHQTNDGAYPGGMMIHMVVDDEEFPNTGDGPMSDGVRSNTKMWRDYARSQHYTTNVTAVRTHVGSELFHNMGNIEKGEAVFRSNCSSCHRYGKYGSDVGPRLEGFSGRRVQDIIDDILAPSRSVDERFSTCVATTGNGKTYRGIVAAEAEEELVLAGPGGARQVIQRRDLHSLKRSSESLMPADMLNKISAKDLLDLLAFIKRWERNQESEE